jgi:hypothetical protein
MGKKSRVGRLSLKKETLRKLQAVDATDLDGVAGGYVLRTARTNCVCATLTCTADCPAGTNTCPTLEC